MDVPAGVTQEEGHTGFFIHHVRENEKTTGRQNVESYLSKTRASLYCMRHSTLSYNPY